MQDLASKSLNKQHERNCFLILDRLLKINLKMNGRKV